MKKKANKELDGATRSSVKQEMAKTRMSKSVRDAQRFLADARIAPDKL